MNLSQMSGALANAAGRIKRGLERAIVGSHELDSIASQFCDSSMLEGAAAEFGKRTLEARIPLEFKVLDTFVLRVDYCISPEEIIEQSDFDPNNWKYVGMRPEWCERDETVVIGNFTRWVDRGMILAWIKEQDDKFRGSGAWVRCAFANLRSEYDGQDEIAFPDKSASLWRDLQTPPGVEAVCSPTMWHDGGRMGKFGMSSIDTGIRVPRRVVLIRKQFGE